MVVAIIAILAALLLPSLRSARESAKTVQCMNNQKQLVLAAMLYTNEHAGQLPNGDDYSLPRDADWAHAVQPYLGNRYPRFVLACPVAKLTNKDWHSVGVLYPNVFGHEDANPSGTKPSAQLSLLPGDTVLTGDNDTNTGLIMSPKVYPFYVDSDGDGVKDDYNGFNIYGNLVFRHQKQALCGFADGSVRKVKLADWLTNAGGMWGP